MQTTNYSLLVGEYSMFKSQNIYIYNMPDITFIKKQPFYSINTLRVILLLQVLYHIHLITPMFSACQLNIKCHFYCMKKKILTIQRGIFWMLKICYEQKMTFVSIHYKNIKLLANIKRMPYKALYLINLCNLIMQLSHQDSVPTAF